MNVERLIAAGGKSWEKGDKRRIYFNDLSALCGLETSHYNTGAISSASIAGESMSNAMAREYASVLSSLKIWFDLSDEKFHYSGASSRRVELDDVASKIIDAIKSKAA